MLSLSLRSALEREVVGQARAIQTVVRSVTLSFGGLANPEFPLGIYLFAGPSGTGKSHMARTLSRVLHGDTQRLAVVDCIQTAGHEEWSALSQQIIPYFRYHAADSTDAVLTMAPLSILLVEHLEQARPELVQALVATVETGRMTLPDGKCGSLAGCLVLMTSNLCAREIYEAGRQEIGFSPASNDLEETEKARIYQLVSTAAEKQWGADVLGHLDDLIVFHRLREAHLPFILRRLNRELNRRLAPRRITCELDSGAAGLVLGRGVRYIRHGAWVLVKVFRRFVVFPIADLVSSGNVPMGSRILVELEEHGGERLRFTVLAAADGTSTPDIDADTPLSIPVEWQEPSLSPR